MRTRQVFCLSLRLPFKQEGSTHQNSHPRPVDGTLELPDDLKVRQHSVWGHSSLVHAAVC